LQREKNDGDENLPNINKTKHPTKGEKKVQDGRNQLQAKKRTTNKGGSQGKHEQIKYSNSSPLQGAYHTRRGRKEEHPTNPIKEVRNTQSIT